jgi:hypothetical protein
VLLCSLYLNFPFPYSFSFSVNNSHSRLIYFQFIQRKKTQQF